MRIALLALWIGFMMVVSIGGILFMVMVVKILLSRGDGRRSTGSAEDAMSEKDLQDLERELEIEDLDDLEEKET